MCRVGAMRERWGAGRLVMAAPHQMYATVVSSVSTSFVVVSCLQLGQNTEQYLLELNKYIAGEICASSMAV